MDKSDFSKKAAHPTFKPEYSAQNAFIPESPENVVLLIDVGYRSPKGISVMSRTMDQFKRWDAPNIRGADELR